MSFHKPEWNIPDDNSLLILDDDKPFRIRLGRAMASRGFEPKLTQSLVEARIAVNLNPPAFAIIDRRLEDGNGMSIVEQLREKRPACSIVMITGYGNIASAVAAIKLGAVNYLAKPVDADDICNALLLAEAADEEIPENPMSASRVRWEHIQRVYELCDNNISETARRLKMHRRTLQRMLAKRAPL
ncbi:MAG: ActR/PrrA/RegA family redox response regulator transcription factor [Acidimicrobiales bacterium]|nr:ActR/PrrA/RegA family redox response regulator transcription factor [Hyphomonadaceae bacterium]RZV44960.1 MAG: ActR/PrrA/RegA family redox response regulator transcription factor [Acidimicrobiales bacterium]